MITFRYKPIEYPNGSVHYTPSIPVVMYPKNGNLEPISVIALVDSGADISVLPRDLAELLGFNLENIDESNLEETRGIGGVTHVIYDSITIKLGNNRENYTLKIPVSILVDPNAEVPPLLGRNGFFDEFEVRFKQRNLKIQLKKENPKVW